MSKHTPGPWEFGVRSDQSLWLSLGDPKVGPHYQGDLCASVVDARLITAAPELLALLADAYWMLLEKAPGPSAHLRTKMMDCFVHRVGMNPRK